jgi:hypothetical protein
MSAKRALRSVVLSAAAIAALNLLPSTAAALCGDGNTDGFITASDALLSLRSSVDGDYDDRLDASPAGGNGTLTATDALAVLRSSVNRTLLDCARRRYSRVAVSTASSRFDSGGVAIVDAGSLTVVERGGALHQDSTIRVQQGRVFGINRQGDNTLQEIDGDDQALATIKECSISDGFDSNPYDFLMEGTDKGYVSAYNGSEVMVLDTRSLRTDTDPACDDLIADRIDLVSLADFDGIPEMDKLAMAGSRLFVVLQILEPFGLRPPAGPGRLAVIDTTTDTLETSVALSLENPFAQTKGIPMLPDAGLLYVGGPGLIYQDLSDGGIEAIDVATLNTSGVLVDGEALGGDLFDFVVVGTRRAFGLVADAQARNVVVEIDLSAGTVTRELFATDAETVEISDIELSERGELWVAVRDEGSGNASGIHIFSIQAPTAGAERAGSPVKLGSPPFTMDFLP